MIAVLAGNYQEFKNFCKDNSITPAAARQNGYVYAEDSNTLRGYKLSNFIILGSFYSRPDAKEIVLTAKTSIIITTNYKTTSDGQIGVGTLFGIPVYCDIATKDDIKLVVSPDSPIISKIQNRTTVNKWALPETYSVHEAICYLESQGIKVNT